MFEFCRINFKLLKKSIATNIFYDNFYKFFVLESYEEIIQREYNNLEKFNKLLDFL